MKLDFHGTLERQVKHMRTTVNTKNFIGVPETLEQANAWLERVEANHLKFVMKQDKRYIIINKHTKEIYLVSESIKSLCIIIATEKMENITLMEYLNIKSYDFEISDNDLNEAGAMLVENDHRYFIEKTYYDEENGEEFEIKFNKTVKRLTGYKYDIKFDNCGPDKEMFTIRPNNIVEDKNEVIKGLHKLLCDIRADRAEFSAEEKISIIVYDEYNKEHIFDYETEISQHNTIVIALEGSYKTIKELEMNTMLNIIDYSSDRLNKYGITAVVYSMNKKGIIMLHI